MKHLFVPDNIAKLLKEKGFNEPCIAYYYGEELIACNVTAGEFVPYTVQKLKEDNHLAPTYDQVLNWFRDKWIWIEVRLFYYDGVHYLPQIAYANPLIELDGCDDYYEGMNAAIKRAIELIK
jgi:hypothetical protein